MKVLFVYHSLYGHTYQLARAVEKGVASVKGAEPVLRRVQEFESVLKETAGSEHANALHEETKNIPVCTVDDLRDADAVLFGSPTRYGNMTAQMKQLIDSTVGLWLKGEMEGKARWRLHLHGIHTRRPGDDPGHHDDFPLAPGHGHRRPALLLRGHDPYGRPRQHPLRGQRPRRCTWRTSQPKPEDLKLGEALGKRVAEVALKVRAK